MDTVDSVVIDWEWRKIRNPNYMGGQCRYRLGVVTYATPYV